MYLFLYQFLYYLKYQKTHKLQLNLFFSFYKLGYPLNPSKFSKLFLYLCFFKKLNFNLKFLTNLIGFYRRLFALNLLGSNKLISKVPSLSYANFSYKKTVKNFSPVMSGLLLLSSISMKTDRQSNIYSSYLLINCLYKLDLLSLRDYSHLLKIFGFLFKSTTQSVLIIQTVFDFIVCACLQIIWTSFWGILSNFKRFLTFCLQQAFCSYYKRFAFNQFFSLLNFLPLFLNFLEFFSFIKVSLLSLPIMKWPVFNESTDYAIKLNRFKSLYLKGLSPKISRDKRTLLSIKLPLKVKSFKSKTNLSLLKFQSLYSDFGFFYKFSLYKFFYTYSINPTSLFRIYGLYQVLFMTLISLSCKSFILLLTGFSEALREGFLAVSNIYNLTFLVYFVSYLAHKLSFTLKIIFTLKYNNFFISLVNNSGKLFFPYSSGRAVALSKKQGVPSWLCINSKKNMVYQASSLLKDKFVLSEFNDKAYYLSFYFKGYFRNLFKSFMYAALSVWTRLLRQGEGPSILKVVNCLGVPYGFGVSPKYRRKRKKNKRLKLRV